jgi:hypothetical protein
MSASFSVGPGRMAWAAVAVVFGLAALTGCSRKAGGGQVHTMGADAAVGSLSYIVSQTDWQDQLEGPDGVRTPTNKYLLVTVSIANHGGEEASVPLLALIDASGREYMEEGKGEGVPNWMGLLRKAGPGQSLSGQLLFDVPPGSYKLRISSGSDVEKERTALVEIPYQKDSAPLKTVDPLTSPATK